jgi:hypothetical protein
MAVEELDAEAIWATIWKLDMITALLSSIVDIGFAGTQTRADDIVVVNCGLSSFGGCFQNGSTT